MRRLHVQIFLTFLAVVVLFALMVSLVWWIGHDEAEDQRGFLALRAVIEEALPPPSASRSELDEVLARIGKRAGARITVRDAEGEILGAFAAPLPDVVPHHDEDGWTIGRDRTAGILLSDGRRVVAQATDKTGRGHLRGVGFLAFILAFVAALALGAYPLARRLTRRLERLRAQADRLGGGDFSARVEVEGRDEVAALAREFNRAADKIEKLVDAQRQTLAAASHELRTPLARLRMAFELLERSDGVPEERATLRARVERDIAELDDLIEELLLASRLDVAPDRLTTQSVDLVGLVAEVSARYDAQVSGHPCVIAGDERLLCRLVRNLLENARRHGDGTAAEITVEPGDKLAVIRVANQGPIIPEAERDRIFAPFYRPPGSPEDGRGFGLGLYLVRQIARRHGGDARCLDHDGGTCFEVTLATVGDGGSGKEARPRGGDRR